MINPVAFRRILFFTAFFAAVKLSFSQPKYEFRAVWIASVDNIDWPSKKGLPVDSQKAEYIRMLDLHQRNGMNAMIVQIRPATDAFYPSPYEPWSEWLTGRQGKPPDPYYDPLEFMIGEAHKRGMEFHAWCNPYRAEFKIGVSSVSPAHPTRLHPEWFLTYGDKRYFDPGNKEAQQFVTNVIRDVVRRYDVDAIHFDDYFYPYRIAGKEFPDDATYRKYGNGLSKDDWRRSNVDSIIVLLSRAIKEEKKYCRFGISPFGVWRNKDKDPEGSNTQAGQTNYDDLYADILLWLRNGWIDYVAPQLYWEFGHPRAAYEVLLDWWSKHTYGRHCYIGLGIYRAGSDKAWRDKTLLPRQIKALRNKETVQGAIYFSSKSFLRNPYGWNDSLQNNYYKETALIPPMEWIDGERPEKPDVKKIKYGHWKIAAKESKQIKGIALYVFGQSELVTSDNKKVWTLFPRQDVELDFTAGKTGDPAGISCGMPCKFAVSIISKNNTESELVLLD
ncbi:MAG: family 10 glycosylhydrolase [Chitinophagaceae bacterium]|nr:family 10 glycosylhydrolase [Chitinophagaceae bacterium]